MINCYRVTKLVRIKGSKSILLNQITTKRPLSLISTHDNSNGNPNDSDANDDDGDGDDDDDDDDNDDDD